MTISPPATPATRTRAALGVIAICLMTVVSAVSGLNVALPSLARGTGANQTELTWIVDAYTVVFSGLLLFAGALGNRYGRKKLLAAGLLVFGGSAAFGLLLDDPAHLIAIRSAMGVGAAAIMPTTLSVITTSFPESERPRAIGAWVGMAGAGAVLGVVVTAVLLAYFEWPSYFAMNVVLAAAGLAGTLAVIPDSVDDRPPALDLVGALLSLLAVAGLVTGIIEAPERGWGDTVTVAALAVGAVAGVAFVAWELTRTYPLLDPRLFRLRGFSAATLAITVQFFATFGLFFTILQYLQFVVGYEPWQAALCLLPLPCVMIPLAREAPRVAARIGFRRVVPVGLALTAVGLSVMSRVTVDLNYPMLAAVLVVFAAGMALAGTPSTTAITASLPPAKQGVASAVNDTARELGSALGIAVLGAALNDAYRSAMAGAVSGLPSQIADVVLSSVAFTQSPQIAAHGAAGAALADAGRHAFVDGVGHALATGSVVLAGTAVVVALLAPRAARAADVSAPRDASAAGDPSPAPDVSAAPDAAPGPAR